MELFFRLLLLMQATILACYGAGTILVRALRVAHRDAWFMLFLRLVLGLVVLTTLYAALHTKGHTVLLPLLLLLPMAAWQLRRTNDSTDMLVERPHLGGPLVAALLAGVVVFSARWFLLYDPASPFLRTPFQDYVYYGRLTLPLGQLGIETSSLTTLYPESLTPSPYHYLELWLNTALVHLSGLPATWTLFLGTYSALIVLVMVGFRAVLAQMGMRGWPAALLALLLVLTTGVYWPQFIHHSFLHNGALLASSLLPVQPKTAPVYLFVLLGGLLLLRARYESAALVLAGLPLVFISTAPASLAGLVGLACYLYATRRLACPTALSIDGLAVVVAFFIGIFYFLRSQPLHFVVESHLASPWLPALSEWHTVLNIGMGTLLNFGVFYMPYGLLVVALLVAARWRLGEWPRLGPAFAGPALCWLLVTVVAAAGMRSIATHLLDSFQFFSNIVIPLMAFSVTVALGLVLAKLPKTWSIGTAVVLLGLAAVNGYKLFSLVNPMHQPTRYSPAFLRQVQAALPALGSRGGYLLADSEYENAYTLNPDAYVVGTYISNFKNNYALISLSAPDPDQVATDPRFVRDAAYARFVSTSSELHQWKLAHGFAARPALHDSAQYLFAKTNRLGFLCVSRRAALPPPLYRLVKTMYRDAWSGEKFYVLQL